MFNFYLSKTGYIKASIPQLEEGFKLLNEIVAEESCPEDKFLKNKNFWEIATQDGLLPEIIFSRFEDHQFANTVCPKLIESIKNIEEDFTTLEEFDNSRYRIYNSFYGAYFFEKNDRHISDKEKYKQFKSENLWNLTASTFWQRKELLFHHLILCPCVKDNLSQIGNIYLNQIKDKLIELEEYVEVFWKNGNFSYDDVNRKTSLNISPESKTTMDQQKYYNQRIFQLPDGRKECFSLHIKTGNLRIYIFPDGLKIYIGYIGKHLDTDKFN